jgi:hypothetical protein
MKLYETFGTRGFDTNMTRAALRSAWRRSRCS